MTSFSQGKKVLFVCYGGGHATMVAPVVKAINARWSEVEVEVLGLTTAWSTIEVENVPFVGFADFIDPLVDTAALKWGRKRFGSNHAIHAGI